MGGVKRSSTRRIEQRQKVVQPRMQGLGRGGGATWWGLDEDLSLYFMGKENSLKGFGQ